ncbi:uncharacterized protein LOC123319060 [Coccinella septempunctata]|uniref:uncharacterized protein LOC123319060 n=1 Tax=Coccinella septempunctata TaxID=41139 RepID=UPI001D05FF40|nr:uncharacterized protein LOC123319060 [Coccinella septempunctata]
MDLTDTSSYRVETKNNQKKRKPVFWTLAATACYRKMMKGPYYCEPVRMFIFYNLFKGQKDWKVHNMPVVETEQTKLPMTDNEIRKSAPFVKMNPWAPSQSGIIESVIYLKYLLKDADRKQKEEEKIDEKSMNKLQTGAMKHVFSMSNLG